MKRALITGITGQDGGYLAEFLLEKGYEVYGMVRKRSLFNTEKIEYLIQNDFEKKFYLVQGDLIDGNSISKLIKEIQPDEVYNLGAQSNVSISFKVPEYTSDVIAMGTLRILEAIKNHCPFAKFFQASSSQIYGNNNELSQKETTSFNPQSPYAMAKAFAHEVTENYRKVHGIFACNGILFNHESPRRGKEFITKKIAQRVTRIKLGQQDFFEIGNLDAKRDWGFAGDYVEAMWMMLQQEKPEDYVIGTGETHSIREFIEEAFRIVGMNVVWEGQGLDEVGKVDGKVVVKVNSEFYRPAEVEVLLSNPEKARMKLNWKSKTSFKELVRMMVEYEEELRKKELIASEIKIKLMEDSIYQEERKSIEECLKKGEYTQGKLVDEFERKFAEMNDSKYAVMVNSGSSANLLMVAILKEKFNLKNEDEVLVPNVTWPTTIYPIIQNSLVPVICDVGEDYNISLESIKRMKSEKTKAIFAVHLLGQPARIKEIKEFCDENNLLLIEDCCESLGAKHQNIKIGNFGIMGSFSFYFGHHITTLEGGMIVTNDYEIYDLLKSMRSHGWIRGTEREKGYADFKNKDYVFDILGYNVRSTNLNASIGLTQLKKLNDFLKTRIENHKYFLEKIRGLPIIPQKVNLEETSSFSLGILFENSEQREYVLENLPKKGVECRPIVTGNLLKQPVFSRLDLKKDSQEMADKIHYNGIYLPNNQFINKHKIDYMVDSIIKLLNEFNLSKKWI